MACAQLLVSPVGVGGLIEREESCEDESEMGPSGRAWTQATWSLTDEQRYTRYGTLHGAHWSLTREHAECAHADRPAVRLVTVVRSREDLRGLVRSRACRYSNMVVILKAEPLDRGRVDSGGRACAKGRVDAGWSVRDDRVGIGAGEGV